MVILFVLRVSMFGRDLTTESVLNGLGVQVQNEDGAAVAKVQDLPMCTIDRCTSTRQTDHI